jgi:phage gp36-like protein
MSQIRVDRYERAVEWLKQVADRKVSIDGAPLLPDETLKDNSPWLMKSNLQRTSHL